MKHWAAAMEAAKDGRTSLPSLQTMADRIVDDVVTVANSRIGQVLNDAVKQLAAALYWEELRKFIAATVGVDEKEAWYIFTPGGSGDVMFAMSFLKAFRERNGGPVILVVPSPFQSLSKLYAGDYDHVVPINPRWDFLSRTHSVKKGEPILAGNSGVPTAGDWLVLLKIVTLNNLYCLLMGLPFHTEPTPPRMPEGAREAARSILETCGLRPGRTVILAPFSRSTTTPPMSWWQELVQALKQRDYDVATNVAEVLGNSRLETIEGTVPVSCLHEQVTALVEEAGFFIASRSGLSDIVSFSNATMRFVYASQNRQKEQNVCAVIAPGDCQSVPRNRPLDPTRAFEWEVGDDGRFDDAILAGF